VVEGAQIVFAEVGVFTDMALREFIAEQEVEAMEALFWGKLKLSDCDFMSDR
jgi:hypothetical protein